MISAMNEFKWKIAIDSNNAMKSYGRMGSGQPIIRWAACGRQTRPTENHSSGKKHEPHRSRRLHESLNHGQIFCKCQRSPKGVKLFKVGFATEDKRGEHIEHARSASSYGWRLKALTQQRHEIRGASFKEEKRLVLRGARHIQSVPSPMVGP